LQEELYSAGGATIDTPEPPADAADDFPIVARTVIQPGGDVLCLVDAGYSLDATLRQLHSDRTAAWYEGAQVAVTSTIVALRRAVLTLASLVFVAGGVFTWPPTALSATLIAATGALVGLVAHAGLRLAAGHLLRRRPP